MLWLNARTSVFVTWGIVLGIYALLAIISMRAASAEVYVTVVSPLHIYMFVIGVTGLKETFAYALGMSVRRTDYYSAVLALAVILSAAFGLAYSAGAVLEGAWFDRPNVTFRMFRMEGFESLAFGGAWFSHAVIFLLLYLLAWKLALLNRRFGQYSLYALAALVILGIALIDGFNGWGPIDRFFLAIGDALDLALWALIPTAVLAASAYALIRRVRV
jgi:hypothetical protein